MNEVDRLSLERFFQDQLARVSEDGKPTNLGVNAIPARHAVGPRKPSLSQLEDSPLPWIEIRDLEDLTD